MYKQLPKKGNKEICPTLLVVVVEVGTDLDGFQRIVGMDELSYVICFLVLSI